MILFGVIRAELIKVFTRGSGIALMAMAVAVPFVCAFAMWVVVNQSGASLNGQSVQSLVSASAIDLGGWALRLRNFYVLPLFLLLAAAQTTAGELSDRTMRDMLVRPVPREGVLAARVVALAVLAALGLLLTFVLSVGLGALFFGVGDLTDTAAFGAAAGKLLLGYTASLASDLGLIVLALLVSLFIRSVGGVVVATVMLLLADMALNGALSAASMFGLEVAKELKPWTLGYALSCWEGYSSPEGFDVRSFVSLAGITAAMAILAILRFRRMDVP